MKYYLLLLFIACVTTGTTKAWQIQIPASISYTHPRLLTNSSYRQTLKDQVTSDEQIRNGYNKIKQILDPYVTRHQADSTWIVSRLMMYWKTKSTDVFVKGPVFDHASGQAPVPTVRFTGARDATSSYGAPKLEDILPYMDDPRGLYLVNNSKPDKPLEWAEPSKAGRVVESINRQIMGMAQNAAFIYWYTGDEKYGKFAFDIFDTYMTGMHYRNEPYDISHSHIQTLVGLSSFEVIHEDIINELTITYDFLHKFLSEKATAKMPLYADTFKKWANLIIKNGVPFNNWNLFEARFVAYIAFILENDDAYPDKKGMQFYLDQILNRSSIRQWSFTELMNKGFDPNTGIWSECPGYSVNVVKDFAEFVALFDRVLQFDLVDKLPLLKKAVLATAQYLYPNGYTVGFGDTHYGQLATIPAGHMVMNAQKNKKPDQELLFTGMVKLVNKLNQKPGAEAADSQPISRDNNIFALLSKSELTLNESVPAGRLEDFVTPTFHAPNVSYFVQRNGLDAKRGLMISQAGSLGNHMHANGIAMELYGKGVVLAPEMGIGTSYFQADYAEYYSQFPAHNTVAVDGISSYPVMRSNHPFELKSSYPSPGVSAGIFPGITYSDIYFLEPETNADQNRLMSIIRTSDSTGYYVDIFRSKRKNGKDKRHDYFYHNLGQELDLTDNAGKPLQLQPSEKLAFADGDLFAYDYLWDRKSAKSDKDFKATYALKVPGRELVFMNMWMKGSPEREIFTVKAPPSKAFRHDVMIPDSIASLPMLTIVARQSGEAWKRPFAAVYEPSTPSQPASISSILPFYPAQPNDNFVGLMVESKAGTKEYIFSSAGDNSETRHEDKNFRGNYAVISENRGGLHYLFLGKGNLIAKGGYSIAAKTDSASAALVKAADGWHFTSNQPVTLTIPAELILSKNIIIIVINNKRMVFTGKKLTRMENTIFSFELPATPYSKVDL